MTNSPRTRRLRLERLEVRETPAVVGALDPTFGTGGKVNIAVANFSPSGTAVDSLGRVVVVGTGNGPVSLNQDFEVIRFNADGTRDTAFGTKFVDFGGNDFAYAVAVAAGDAIVVAGTDGNGRFAVAELDAAGAPAAGFGTGGKAAFYITGGGQSSDTANAVAIDPVNGDIVVVGESVVSQVAVAVARLSPAGVLSNTFGTGNSGSVRFQIDPTEFGSIGYAVAFDGQGRIVVGAAVGVQPSGTNAVGVARLSAAGAFDTTFDADGKTLVALPAAVTGVNFFPGTVGVGVDAADNVYVGADVNTATQLGTFAVSKLLAATGGLDTTYGTGGTFVSTLAGAGSGRQGNIGLAVRPTGQAVVGGATLAGTGGINFLVAQVTPAGAIDPTFNPAGTTPGYNPIDFAGNNDLIAAFTLAASGKAVLVGRDQTTSNLELARVNATTGKAALAVGGSTDATGSLFAPGVGGQFVTTPAATASPFGAGAFNVRTALGDVNGDGFEDTILVTGPGTATRFAVVSGLDGTTVLIPPTAPFVGSEAFAGGGFVAAGDFNGDGRAEIAVTPDQGGGPRVTIYAFTTAGAKPSLLANFFTLGEPTFQGGVRVAAGDVNNDGVDDLVVAAGFQGGPRVNVIDGKTVLSTQTVLANFFAFPDSLRNGVFVAVGDVNGDGFGDIIVGAGPGGGPVLEIISGQLLLTSGFAPATDAVPGTPPVTIPGSTPGSALNPGANGAAGTTIPGTPGTPATPGSPTLLKVFAGDPNNRSGLRVAAVDADGDGLADIAIGPGGNVAAKVTVFLGKNLAAASQTFDVFGAATNLTDGIFVG